MKFHKFDFKKIQINQNMQEAQWIPSGMNSKIFTVREITIRLLKVKETNSKTAIRKIHGIYKGTAVTLTADFSWNNGDKKAVLWHIHIAGSQGWGGAVNREF